MALRSSLVIVFAALSLSCVTNRKDVTGTGDERLDENESKAGPATTTKAAESSCGPDGQGTIVLLDARTASPVSCALVTITRENAECVSRCKLLAGDQAPAIGGSGTQCPDGSICPSERVFNGRANKVGQVNAAGLGTTEKLTAVAEGYTPTLFDPAPPKPNTLVEVELMPETGFLLKLVDEAGNYLPDLSATFKQGESVLAQLRSNELANVYFAQRTPFSGEAVTVEVQGYQASQIRGPEDLGSDGHTLVLKK